jgi:hypothetical protein
MVDLDSAIKSKIRFHLAYNSAVPVGYRTRLETNMASVPDAYTSGQIGTIVGRCETAFALTAPGTSTLYESERENVTASTAQVTTVSKRDSEALRQRTYNRECQTLAIALGVRNFRDESVLWPELIDASLFDPVYLSVLPAGGTTGQSLKKLSNTSYDVGWI